MNREVVSGSGCGQGKRKFPRKLSEFDPLLGPDAGVEWVLDFGNLGYQVCGFDQFRGRVATGYDDM